MRKKNSRVMAMVMSMTVACSNVPVGNVLANTSEMVSNSDETSVKQDIAEKHKNTKDEIHDNQITRDEMVFDDIVFASDSIKDFKTGNNIILDPVVSMSENVTDVSYVWKVKHSYYEDAQIINGETSRTLNINDCTIDDTATYVCSVSYKIDENSYDYDITMPVQVYDEMISINDSVSAPKDCQLRVYKINVPSDNKYEIEVTNTSDEIVKVVHRSEELIDLNTGEIEAREIYKAKQSIYNIPSGVVYIAVYGNDLSGLSFCVKKSFNIWRTDSLSEEIDCANVEALPGTKYQTTVHTDNISEPVYEWYKYNYEMSKYELLDNDEASLSTEFPEAGVCDTYLVKVFDKNNDCISYESDFYLNSRMLIDMHDDYCYFTEYSTNNVGTGYVFDEKVNAEIEWYKYDFDTDSYIIIENEEDFEATFYMPGIYKRNVHATYEKYEENAENHFILANDIFEEESYVYDSRWGDEVTYTAMSSEETQYKYIWKNYNEQRKCYEVVEDANENEYTTRIESFSGSNFVYAYDEDNNLYINRYGYCISNVEDGDEFGICAGSTADISVDVDNISIDTYCKWYVSDKNKDEYSLVEEHGTNKYITDILYTSKKYKVEIYDANTDKYITQKGIVTVNVLDALNVYYYENNEQYIKAGEKATSTIYIDNPYEIDYTMQWYMYDDKKKEYLPIEGATSNTYTTEPITKNVKVEFVITDEYGGTIEVSFEYIPDYGFKYNFPGTIVGFIDGSGEIDGTVISSIEEVTDIAYEWSKYDDKLCIYKKLKGENDSVFRASTTGTYREKISFKYNGEDRSITRDYTVVQIEKILNIGDEIVSTTGDISYYELDLEQDAYILMESEGIYGYTYWIDNYNENTCATVDDSCTVNALRVNKGKNIIRLQGDLSEGCQVKISIEKAEEFKINYNAMIITDEDDKANIKVDVNGMVGVGKFTLYECGNYDNDYESIMVDSNTTGKFEIADVTSKKVYKVEYYDYAKNCEVTIVVYPKSVVNGATYVDINEYFYGDGSTKLFVAPKDGTYNIFMESAEEEYESIFYSKYDLTEEFEEYSYAYGKGGILTNLSLNEGDIICFKVESENESSRYIIKGDTDVDIICGEQNVTSVGEILLEPNKQHQMHAVIEDRFGNEYSAYWEKYNEQNNTWEKIDTEDISVLEIDPMKKGENAEYSLVIKYKDDETFVRIRTISIYSDYIRAYEFETYRLEYCDEYVWLESGYEIVPDAKLDIVWYKYDDETDTYVVLEDVKEDYYIAPLEYGKYKRVITVTKGDNTESAETLFYVAEIPEGYGLNGVYVDYIEIYVLSNIELSAPEFGDNYHYTWYRKESFDGEYELIEGENDAQLRKKENKVGNVYYKCVITNTHYFEMTCIYDVLVQCDCEVYGVNEYIKYNSSVTLEPEVYNSLDNTKYQWYVFNNDTEEYEIINGATSLAYTTPNLKDKTKYKIELMTENGEVYASGVSMVTIDTGICTSQCEIDIKGEYGEKLTLESYFRIDDGFSLTYCWYEFDNEKCEFIPIEGAQETSLSVEITSKKTYKCEATDNCGNTCDNTFYVIPNYKIKQTGTYWNVMEDGKAVISAKADSITEGYTVERYQWYKNGQLIEGANEATYEATEADEYLCTYDIMYEGKVVDSRSVYRKTISDIIKEDQVNKVDVDQIERYQAFIPQKTGIYYLHAGMDTNMYVYDMDYQLIMTDDDYIDGDSESDTGCKSYAYLKEGEQYIIKACDYEWELEGREYAISQKPRLSATRYTIVTEKDGKYTFTPSYSGGIGDVTIKLYEYEDYFEHTYDADIIEADENGNYDLSKYENNTRFTCEFIDEIGKKSNTIVTIMKDEIKTLPIDEEINLYGNVKYSFESKEDAYIVFGNNEMDGYVVVNDGVESLTYAFGRAVKIDAGEKYVIYFDEENEETRGVVKYTIGSLMTDDTIIIKPGEQLNIKSNIVAYGATDVNYSWYVYDDEIEAYRYIGSDFIDLTLDCDSYTEFISNSGEFKCEAVCGDIWVISYHNVFVVDKYCLQDEDDSKSVMSDNITLIGKGKKYVQNELVGEGVTVDSRNWQKLNLETGEFENIEGETDKEIVFDKAGFYRYIVSYHYEEDGKQVNITTKSKIYNVRDKYVYYGVYESNSSVPWCDYSIPGNPYVYEVPVNDSVKIGLYDIYRTSDEVYCIWTKTYEDKTNSQFEFANDPFDNEDAEVLNEHELILNVKDVKCTTYYTCKVFDSNGVYGTWNFAVKPSVGLIITNESCEIGTIYNYKIGSKVTAQIDAKADAGATISYQWYVDTEYWTTINLSKAKKISGATSNICQYEVKDNSRTVENLICVVTAEKNGVKQVKAVRNISFRGYDINGDIQPNKQTVLTAGSENVDYDKVPSIGEYVLGAYTFVADQTARYDINVSSSDIYNYNYSIYDKNGVDITKYDYTYANEDEDCERYLVYFQAKAGEEYIITVEDIDANAYYSSGTFGTTSVNVTSAKKDCKHVNIRIEGEKKATYEAVGHTGDTYCDDCEKHISYDKEIAKLQAPAAPATLGLAMTNKGITLKWSASKGATGYYIYRDGKLIKDVTTTTYNDSTAKVNGTKYSYKVVPYVTASGKKYAGKASSVKEIWYLSAVKISSAVNADKSVKLTWSKNAKATGYIISRSDNGGKFKEIATIKKAATVTYIDKTAKNNGTKYTYKITPYKTNTSNKGLESATFTTKFVNKMTIKTIKNPSKAAAKLTWAKSVKATGYEIKYTVGGKSKTVTVKKGSTVAAVIKSLKKGKTYSFTMRAFITEGKVKYVGEWSTVKSLKIVK